MNSIEKTLNYYNENADLFKNDTVNVEFEEKRNILLKYLSIGDDILDLGCGAGRDAKAFIDMGYKVVAVDGSEELCKIASDYIGENVICKKFNDLEYRNEFDGIWACASLLHIEHSKLEEVFKRVTEAIRVRGYFYASFKYGDFEGYRNERYFTDFTEDKFSEFIKKISGIKVLEYKVTSDARVSRANEKWLNIIMQKVN
ncbi:MAG: class I SAM-dependent methyltransferase [Sarcina sp.]